MTADDLVATVMLMRDVERNAIILMEGESDCGIFDPHLTEFGVTLPGYGKRNVVAAFTILRGSGDDRVAAVVDSDWTGMSDEPPLPEVVYSENYDLDVDVFLTKGVLERFFSAHFGRDALARAASDGGSVTSLLMAAAAPVGILRHLSERDGLGLAMREFPVEQVIDVPALSCNVKRLTNLAVARSGVNCDPVDLERAVQEVFARSSASELVRFVCGHDLCAVIALAGRRVFEARGLGRESVERALRCAIGCDEFARLQVAELITKWSDSLGLQLWDHAHVA